MRRTRIGAVLIVICAAFSSAAADTTLWEKRTGNSNFGTYVKVDTDYGFQSKSQDTYLLLEPSAGARMFGGDLDLLSVEGAVGNYGEYSKVRGPRSAWNAVGASDWHAYVAARAFGVAFWVKNSKKMPNNTLDLGETNTISFSLCTPRLSENSEIGSGRERGLRSAL